MGAWAVRDRNDTWDAVCDRAWAGEPQFVTRGGTQTVVVISYVDYQPNRSKRRHIAKNPKLAFKINDADLFSDDSSQWEANND